MLSVCFVSCWHNVTFHVLTLGSALVLDLVRPSFGLSFRAVIRIYVKFSVEVFE